MPWSAYSFRLLLDVWMTQSAEACLWDRDTSAQEGRKHMDVIETVVGLFDRYPSLYYELRLKRVTSELAGQPHRLDLYDDAAVACARLGKPDDAIQWMNQKSAILKLVPDSVQEYRYLANLGTFRLQRWVMQKDRNANLGDLDEAIRLIQQALSVNPDAHFGRERAQLTFMQWLRAGYGSSTPSSAPPVADLGSWLAKVEKFNDWPRALQGLIRQGIAWESIDAFNCLSTLMGPELNYLVTLRTRELLKAGVMPLQADRTYIESWAKIHASGMTYQGATMLGNIDRSEAARIEAFYHKARKKAEERHKELQAFMLLKLQAGEHPDSHPGFWEGWDTEVSVPPLPFGSWAERWKMLDGEWLVADSILYLFLAALALLFAWGLVKLFRVVADMIEG